MTDISLKMDVAKAADLLVTRHGVEATLKTAAMRRVARRVARLKPILCIKG